MAWPAAAEWNSTAPPGSYPEGFAADSRVECCGCEAMIAAVRLLIVPLLLLSAPVLPAQESIPLPVKKAPAIPAPEPAPQTPGLPRVQMAPTAPAFPVRPTPAPRVRLSNRESPGVSNIHGGQFFVHGKVKEQRDVLLEEAERVRRMVATALGTGNSFTIPVVIQIREGLALPPGRPSVWTAIAQAGEGFRIELNLVPRFGGVDGPLLRQELVRCILAERLLRPHAAQSLAGRDIPPPDWLLHGALELLDYQALGRPSDAFSAVFRLGHVMSLEDIFEADPAGMDSVSRAVYRASCCGLVLMLLERSGMDRRNFNALCDTLALMPSNDTGAIARAYPELNSSGHSLGKWWSLQLAAMSSPGMDELLSPAMTDAELTRALTLHLPALPAEERKERKGLAKVFGKKKPADSPKEPGTPVTAAAAEEFPLTEFSRATSRKDREEIFNRVELGITKLSLRAHPLYRPVLGRYLALVKDLGQGKKQKEAAAHIASLDAMRQQLLKEMRAAEDYLDWHEATQAGTISGDFSDYFRAVRESENPASRARPDPISRYLDLIETEYRE